jgi:hypothetical protein
MATMYLHYKRKVVTTRSMSKNLAVASATNWATSTPRENAPGRAKQLRRMTQLVGVTCGSPPASGQRRGYRCPFRASAFVFGERVVLHIRFKIWFYSDGLQEWREETNSDQDVMAKATMEGLYLLKDGSLVLSPERTCILSLRR